LAGIEVFGSVIHVGPLPAFTYHMHTEGVRTSRGPPYDQFMMPLLPWKG